MKSHFCKVRRVIPNFEKILDLRELKHSYAVSMEELYSIKHIKKDALDATF